MDLANSFNSIPSGIYSLVGVVLGFGLNWFKDYLSNRAKLYYSLQQETPYEGWDYSTTSKTGPSGYLIEIYNCGKNPALINNVRIEWKNNLIDTLIPEPVTILPYHSYKFELSKQDYEVLIRWVEINPKISSVKVIAYTMDGGDIRGDLDITFISMQAQVCFTNLVNRSH